MAQRTLDALDKADGIITRAQELQEEIDTFWREHLELSAFIDFTALLRADHGAMLRLLRDQVNGLRRLVEEPEPEPEPELVTVEYADAAEDPAGE